MAHGVRRRVSHILGISCTPRLTPTMASSGTWRRRRPQETDPPPQRQPLQEPQEPVSIAVDSTRIKVHKTGGWIERKHGRGIKLHFAVNTVTHEVVAMEISTDDMHDVKALPGLVEESARVAVRYDERMRMFYGRAKRRLGDGKAIVAVACKMLKISCNMWMNNPKISLISLKEAKIQEN